MNNVLKWSLGELKLRFRTNMSHFLYNQYLKGFTYYKMSNLDNRIANADQLLTTDIDKFCESVTDLYSNVSKPLLDIMIYVYRLTTTLGGQTPSILLAYLLVAGVFLTHLRRPTGEWIGGFRGVGNVECFFPVLCRCFRSPDGNGAEAGGRVPVRQQPANHQQ